MSSVGTWHVIIRTEFKNDPVKPVHSDSVRPNHPTAQTTADTSSLHHPWLLVNLQSSEWLADYLRLVDSDMAGAWRDVNLADYFLLAKKQQDAFLIYY